MSRSGGTATRNQLKLADELLVSAHSQRTGDDPGLHQGRGTRDELVAPQPRQGTPPRRRRLKSALSEPTRERDLGWGRTAQRRPTAAPAEDVQADPHPRRDGRAGIPCDSSSLGDREAVWTGPVDGEVT